CLFLDLGLYDLLRGLFADDARIQGGLDPDYFETPDEFVANRRERLSGTRMSHQLHNPMITFTGPSSARALWAFASMGFGAGYYEDEYRREDGIWKIVKAELTWAIAPPEVDPGFFERRQPGAVAARWRG